MQHLLADGVVRKIWHELMTIRLVIFPTTICGGGCLSSGHVVLVLSGKSKVEL